jgi:hypothetical protein
MNFNKADVVRVSLPLLDFLHGIRVEDAQVHIVCGGDDPLLPNNKLCTSNWDFAQLEAFDKSLQTTLSSENGWVLTLVE